MDNPLRTKVEGALEENGGRMELSELEGELEDRGVQVCFYKEGELESKIKGMDVVDGEAFAVDVYHGRKIVEAVEYGL